MQLLVKTDISSIDDINALFKPSYPTFTAIQPEKISVHTNESNHVVGQLNANQPIFKCDTTEWLLICWP